MIAAVCGLAAVLATGPQPGWSMEVRAGATGSGKEPAEMVFSVSGGSITVLGARLENGAPVFPVYCAKSGRQYPEITLASSEAYHAAAQALKTGAGAASAAAVKDCMAKADGICVTAVRVLKPNRFKTTVLFDGALAVEFMTLKITNSKTGKSYYRLYEPDSVKLSRPGLRGTVRRLAGDTLEKLCPGGTCDGGAK